MIKTSDIAVTVESAQHHPSQRIRAELRATKDRFTMGDGTTEVEREQERCREEIWHHIYGDISKEAHALQRAVMPLLSMGAHDSVSEAFRKFQEMLAFKVD